MIEHPASLTDIVMFSFKKNSGKQKVRKLKMFVQKRGKKDTPQGRQLHQNVFAFLLKTSQKHTYIILTPFNPTLSQGYQKTKLVATLKKFYGRHHDLVNPYNVAVSRIVSDVFASDAP